MTNSARPAQFAEPGQGLVFGQRVLVADGAMGTMLQASDVSLDDFDGHEGCNEILERHPAGCGQCRAPGLPGGRRGLHHHQHIRGERRQPGRIRTGRADRRAVRGGRPAGPGGGRASGPPRAGPAGCSARSARAPSCPRSATLSFAGLRDAYQQNVAGLLRGGVDAIIIETCQDLLQAKAAVVGARRAMAAAGAALPLIAQVTIETTGAMLLGSEIGAALTALEPLGITMIGLNCATGPGEMGEHLRYLASHARPFAVLHAQRRPARAHPGGRAVPAEPGAAGRRARHVHRRVRPGPGRRLLRDHARASVRRGGPGARPAGAPPPAPPRARGGLALPARPVPAGHLVPGHRRADQRERVQGVPRGAHRGPLRRLRGDRPGADQGRRAPARRVRGLRRPGRPGRHGRGGGPAGHRGHAAAGHRLHRAGGDPHRAGTAGRPGRGQLGQLRGRRRARLADRAGHADGRRSTAPRSSR